MDRPEPRSRCARLGAGGCRHCELYRQCRSPQLGRFRDRQSRCALAQLRKFKHWNTSKLGKRIGPIGNPLSLSGSRRHSRGRNNRNPALYVFAYGSNGHLYLFVWSDQSSSWLGIDEHIESQFAGITVTGRVGVDSFVDDASVLRVYAFVIGSTGRVYVNYYDGTGVTGWHWSDQGLMNPQGTTASVGVGVTHFRGSGGINIYASVIGSDNVVYLNWLNPTWYALPTYPGLTPYTDVGATAFVNSDGSQGLYIMTTATVAWSNVERDLQLDFYSSSTHQWQALDQGSL